MATGAEAAVDQDQGWQDYTPPTKPAKKPPTPQAAPQSSSDGGWVDYQPEAQGGGGKAPAPVSNKPIVNKAAGVDETQTETPEDRQYREFLLGTASGASGLKESVNPIQDTIAGTKNLYKDPDFYAGEILGPGYGLAKGLYGLGKGIFAPEGHSEEERAENRAHALGETAGQVLPMAVGSAAGEVEPSLRAREFVGDRLRDPATGDMTPRAQTNSAILGGAAGGAYGLFKGNPYEALVGVSVGARMAPSVVENLFPESRARASGRLFDKNYNTALEEHTANMDAQTKAREQAHKDFADQVSEIEKNRQKELAGQERLKEQDARARNARKEEEPEPTPSNPFPSATATNAPIGRTMEPAGGVPQGNPTPFNGGGGGTTTTGRPMTFVSPEEAAASRRATAAENKPRIITSETTETPRTGNEGRAATWSEADMREKLEDPNTSYLERRAIAAQLGIRMKELPENYRYLAGDIDAGRAAASNPREIFRFNAEGQSIPIRETSNPEPSTRGRIWTPDEEAPAPGTPAPDAGRVRNEVTVQRTVKAPAESAPKSVGKPMTAEEPQRTDLVAPKAKTPTKEILKSIGLTLRGEYPAGSYDIKDNWSGSTITIPKEGFNEAKLRDATKEVRAKWNAEREAAQQPAPEAQTGSPTGTERRSAGQETGPRTHLVNPEQRNLYYDLKNKLNDPNLDPRDREIIASQISDLQGHPFDYEKLPDLKSMKVEKTMSREEAAAASAKRTEGRNARFSEEAAAEEKEAAKADQPNTKRVQEEFTEEELATAEGTLRQELGMLGSIDRPGRYPVLEEGHYGGGGLSNQFYKITDWRGSSSARPQMPFLSQHPEISVPKLEKALEKDGGNPIYQRAMRAAIEFNRSEYGKNAYRAKTEAPSPDAEVEERQAIQEESGSVGKPMKPKKSGRIPF